MTWRKGNASGEPEAYQRGGGETTTQQSIPRTATTDGFTDLLEEMSAGRYRPRPGSVGARLVSVHTDACAWHSNKSMRLFAKVAVKAEGVWWAIALDADADDLNPADADYVVRLWRSWLSGDNPFRTRRRHVA